MNSLFGITRADLIDAGIEREVPTLTMRPNPRPDHDRPDADRDVRILHCPYCGAQLPWAPESTVRRCPNLDCHGRVTLAQVRDQLGDDHAT